VVRAGRIEPLPTPHLPSATSGSSPQRSRRRTARRRGSSIRHWWNWARWFARRERRSVL